MPGAALRKPPAQEAWELMGALFAGNRRRFLQAVGEHELTPPQWILLSQLQDGPRAMGDLADTLACDSSNITGMVDRLEERGLVERRPAPADRRVRLVALTDDGERLREEIQGRLAAAVPPALLALAPADQRALRDLLRRAVAA